LGWKVNKSAGTLYIRININRFKWFFSFDYVIINGSIKVKVKAFFIRAIVWLMSCLFILNTLGNLIAKSSIETIVFTPITIMLSVFSFYLAINFNKIYHS
jgi:hypothetical protein